MNLEDIKDKTILMFGKPRAFSIDEFESQMKHHNITLVKEMNDAVSLSVDGRMMTPYEQIASDALYEKGSIKSVGIDELERALAEDIDKDTLLMSLKLSHDKERLKCAIENSMLDDEIFFSLMKMYSWGGEDFFENDDNRDVSAAFIARFYENIERNHNVQYATTGFIHLVAQAKSSDVLLAISLLEPLKFHPKIKTAIAMHPKCNTSMQKRFFKSDDAKILEALSFNQNLEKKFIKEFAKNEYLGLNVARSVLLSDELFKFLNKFTLGLAQNETLSEAMQLELVELHDNFVNMALASNSCITLKIIEKLHDNSDDELKMALYKNSATPHDILNIAYENEKYHVSLAQNENTPVAILYQLQLDARYERMVKTNAGFGKHIQGENIGWLV